MSQKFQKIHNKTVHRQFQIKVINKHLKKYLKKDIYLQNKNKKLLIISILI